MDPSFRWGDGKWMSEVTVAALQLAFSDDVEANIAAVSGLVREAALFGDALHAVVEDARKAGPAAKEYLIKEGFEVESVTAVMPSLEDVFVSLIEEEDRKAAVKKAA